MQQELPLKKKQKEKKSTVLTMYLTKIKCNKNMTLGEKKFKINNLNIPANKERGWGVGIWKIK